jgi:RND family efflux transporter MFP subunit
MENETLNKLKIDKSALASVHQGRRRWLLWGVMAGVLLLVLALLMIRSRGIRVETTSVVQTYPTQAFTLLNASGYLVAQRKAAVASKITGRLEWLGVEEGSRVKAGQVLARLENQDLSASLDQARAALQTARAELDQAVAEQDDATKSFARQQELIKQGIVARSEYDLAEARYRRAVAAAHGARSSIRSAESLLRGAEVAYDYAQIRAPFDGVVLTKNADVGDIITPLGAAANAKAAVVTMADLTSLQVEADVAESSLVHVRTGQPCEITLDALPGSRFRGVVHTIVPTADRSKASVMVKIRFVELDNRILPEMSAKVSFLSREATKEDQLPRLVVNPLAVAKQGQEAKVYRINGNRAEAVVVTLGQKYGDLIEVGGLESGERLVLRPLERINNGSRIVVPEP